MLSVPSFLPLFLVKPLSIHERVFSLVPFKFSVLSIKSLFFLCGKFSFTQPVSHPLLDFRQTIYQIGNNLFFYNLIYLHYYIHIVLAHRKEDVFNLYFLYRLLQFVFIISTYSPLLVDSPFCFFLELRDAFTVKKRFFLALFCE